MSEEDRFEAEEKPQQAPEWDGSAPDDRSWPDDEAKDADGADKVGADESGAAPSVWRGPSSGGGGVRALAEGAMMTALTLILAVISMYVPILNIVAQFLFPAPLALLVLRHGLKFGCIAAASVFLLSTLLLGLPQAIYLFILYGFLGLFFGWCFRARKKATFTLLTGVLLTCAAILLMLLFPTYILGVSLEQYREMLSTVWHDYALMIGQQGNTALLAGMSVEEYAEYLLAFTMRLLPGMLFVVAMAQTLICYLLMGRLLRRFNYDIPQLPPFREWRLDWRLLWLLIAALVASSLGERLQLDLLAQIANNLLTAFFIIFTVYGFSVLSWVFKRFKISAFIQVLAVLLALQLFSGMLLPLLGVFDPLFDFRRRLEQYAKKRE